MSRSLFAHLADAPHRSPARLAIVIAGLFGLLTAGKASAQTTVLDDFETNEGRFTTTPFGGSGSSAGFLATSTADRVTSTSFTGVGSQQIFIDDDPAVNPPTLDNTAWRLRHLSGGGTPANNLSLTNGPNAWVGFWLQTTTTGIRASLTIDDGTATERATRTPIIADGQWHLYQWNLGNPNDWDAFAGTGANGAIDAATVTLDALYFDAPLTAGDQNATFFIDDVSFNPVAPVPEPGTVLALGAAGLGLGGLLRRRLRRRSDALAA